MDKSINTSADRWWRLQKMIDIIRYESRFITTEPYKSFVDSVVSMVREQLSSTIQDSSILYRARINKIDFENKEHDKLPFPASEMGTPPQLLATSGRINPEGISYLYCSGEVETAGAELRPWKGAFLTIAELEITKDINIADLTLECNDDDWKMFLYDFADMFSMQWPPELKLNYLVTQYFSEHFKAAGFRGIKYNSTFNVGGTNFALFYKDDYAIYKTYSVETSEISYFFYEHRNV
jgi:hypothetical protein